MNGAYLMYGNTSAGVGVGGVLLSGSFYMCPTVECILCSENVYQMMMSYFKGTADAVAEYCTAVSCPSAPNTF